MNNNQTVQNAEVNEDQIRKEMHLIVKKWNFLLQKVKDEGYATNFFHHPATEGKWIGHFLIEKKDKIFELAGKIGLQTILFPPKVEEFCLGIQEKVQLIFPSVEDVKL